MSEPDVDRNDGGGSEDLDLVDRYLEDQRFHGKAERTRASYERVLRDFEAFLADPERGPGGRSGTPDAADRRECMAWVHALRDSHAPSTVASYASYVHRFYAYMTQVGELADNPMALVVEEMDEAIDPDPTRRDVSLGEMRAFVASVTHPLERAVIVTLLKTGMRVGECCNLDLRDLHLPGSSARAAFDADPRVHLDGRGASLYVSSEPSRGAVVNGEERYESNKRKRDTVVPVDEELRAVLEAWLAVRPDARSAAEPLFVDTSEAWGERLRASGVRSFVTRHARDAGWYRTGGGASENVTPHYFRHFFTTHLRDRTGDRGVVKYLRGDVASDVIDTYTHDWGSRIGDVYEDHIYSVFG
ncbi:tyrosine-type recombinase/integrase [Halorubellus sp. PRR65]|uniref:tyrosine-type recombinase/integrase n=1 Tax=Halorubellus sp. PRR65 TaxID=3098148 RepID=UPI002B260977|nr:tyrosine-type recombinase/integrase [Halorubellus sp. PRR65]